MMQAQGQRILDVTPLKRVELDEENNSMNQKNSYKALHLQQRKLEANKLNTEEFLTEETEGLLKDKFETSASSVGKIKTSDGILLWYRRYENKNAKANVIILHSFNEHIGFYEHVAKRFFSSDYSVVTFDQRGTGQSEGTRGHLKSIDRYALDVKEIIDNVVNNRMPVFLYGNSTGAVGAIYYALKTIENQEKTNTTSEQAIVYYPPIAGVIITSPFFKSSAQASTWQKKIINFLSKTIQSYTISAEMSLDALTRDLEMQQMILEDKLRSNDMSAKQIMEWEKASQICLSKASLLTIPLLALHGQADEIANLSSTQQFVSSYGSSDKEFSVIQNFRHALHLELDRENQVFRKIIQWLDKHQSVAKDGDVSVLQQLKVDQLVESKLSRFEQEIELQ